MVCNPPWGRRVKGEQGALRSLDQRLADLPGGVRVGLVLPAKDKRIHLDAARVTSRVMTDHGAIMVLLLSGATGAAETS